GEHNTAAGLVQAVIAEDPDVLGLSFSTSTYVHQITALMAEMDRVDVADVPVMVGGLIHPDDESALKELGVAAIFGPGSTIDAIVQFLESSRS
ncbi:cobalamin B12-binding domain-containing protein, partial [Streptomyces sp. NPDC058171]